MPAVKLVNIAPSDPVAAEVEAFLHQKIRGTDVHGWKPIPRDPTASTPCHHLGPTFTTFAVPEASTVFDGASMSEDRALTADEQSRLVRHDWAMHSDCAMPAFVLPETASSKADVALAKAVAARFNAKRPSEADAEARAKAYTLAGRPQDADKVHAYYLSGAGLGCHVWIPGQDADPSVPEHQLIQLLAATEVERWEAMLAHIEGPTALLLNGGRDSVLKNAQTTGAQDAAYNYVSLSANATAPVASDTTLTGEITTAGGGLAPGQGTYAHTNGASTSTLTKTHTANGSDSLPVTIAQVGIRNAAAAGGTLGTKSLLSSPAALSSSGDALTSTITTTLSPS